VAVFTPKADLLDRIGVRVMVREGAARAGKGTATAADDGSGGFRAGGRRDGPAFSRAVYYFSVFFG